MIRSKAFTLIELLLSAVVFTLVSTLAMVTIATTVRLQAASRQSQGIAIQAAHIQRALQQDLSHLATGISGADYSLRINDSSMSYGIEKPEQPGFYTYRMVCVDDKNRLVRYTSSLRLSQCGGSNPEFLTDDTTAASRVSFRTISAGSARAVQVEMSLSYDPEIAGKDNRATQKSAPPLVFTYLLSTNL